MRAKIADFGVSKILNTNKEATQYTNDVGTHQYVAPEVYDGIYSQKADCYSFGILL